MGLRGMVMNDVTASDRWLGEKHLGLPPLAPLAVKTGIIAEENVFERCSREETLGDCFLIRDFGVVNSDTSHKNTLFLCVF